MQIGGEIYCCYSLGLWMIQFPPKMDENWLRYELLNLGQIYETKLAEDVVLCVHNFCTQQVRYVGITGIVILFGLNLCAKSRDK